MAPAPVAPATASSSFSMLFLLVAVVAPSLLVMIMNGIEALVEPLGRIRRSMKVGWDLCVLGLGAAGGIILDPDVLGFLGTGGAIASGSISVVSSLGFSVIIAHLRRRNNPGRGSAVLALVLGALALEVPAFLALHRH